jgi:RHS repeat-associated protein
LQSIRTITVGVGTFLVLAVIALVPDANAFSGGPSPGAVSSSTLSIPDKPASIKGLADDASISIFSAQVSYSVPIDVPSGRAGFGPGLALSYAGELGNGPAGIGWSIGRIAIQRSLREGVPTYTDADEFELVGIGGGGRLVPDECIDNRYWVEGHGSRIRVDRRGNWWDVRDGSGSRYMLGSTSATQQGEGARVSAWFVESIQDVTRSQTIKFSYHKGFNEIYLDAIEYGPESPISHFRVEVEYQDQARPDETISWARGYEVRTRERIESVRVLARNGTTGQRETLRTYHVQYAAALHLSRISNIRMTGRGGSGELPSLTFGYVPATPSDKRVLEGTEGWRLNERGVSIFDVDGDGMSDLMRAELGNHGWRKNLGGRFDTVRELPGAGHTDLESVRYMDLDGDARPELVSIVDDTWRVYKLVGQGNNFQWEPQGVWPGTSGVALHDERTMFADINGDGRTDVIEGGAGRVAIRFNSQTGLLPPIRRDQLVAVSAEIEPGHPYLRLQDFNGDKLADLVFMTDTYAKVWLGRGDGTFAAHATVEYPWGRGAFEAGDVLLEDLDRDGLLDIIRMTAGHVAWYPGRPNNTWSNSEGRFLVRPTGASEDAIVTTGDLDGDGASDVVWSTGSQMWIMDFASTGHQGMLESIDNGLGKTSRYYYLSSATLSVQAENNGRAWERKLPVAIPVPVRGETRFADTTPMRTAIYNVEDGFWDGTERRFGGFLKSIASVPDLEDAKASVSETRYHPGIGRQRVLRGQAWFSQVKNRAGQIYSETTNTLEVKPFEGCSANPLLSYAITLATKTLHLEGVTTPIETRSSFEHDPRGRVIAEHHLGRVTLPGDEKEIRRTYADEAGSPSAASTWVRDKVCEEVLLSGNGTPISRSRTVYTDTSNLSQTGYEGVNPDGASPCSGVGFGWVMRSEAYLSDDTGGGRYVVQSSRVYDAFGNPTQVYEGGVTRDLDYDTQHFRPESESVIPTAGGSPLTWTMSWDPVLGQPLTLTDPNSDTTNVTYDSLGRVTGIGVNGQPSHIMYQYDWTAPRPRTATLVWDKSLEEGVQPLSTLGSIDSAPLTDWRKTVAVANGAGEDLYSATYLGEQSAANQQWVGPYEQGARTWIISGWKERDQRGRVVRVADPFYSGALPTAMPGGYAAVQALEYDALDRLTRQVLPNGGTKQIAYKAFEQTVTSSELAPVTSFMDGFSRIIQTSRIIPEGPAGMPVPQGSNGAEGVTAVYDAADRILEMSLQGGVAVHRFSYDSLGRLVSAHDPDIGNRTMTYEDWGWLKTHTNGAGQTVQFDYDAAGRLTSRKDVSRTPALEYSYHYDVAAPPGVMGPLANFSSTCAGNTAGRQKGRLSWVNEPHGVVCMGYDQMGRQNMLERRLFAGATPTDTSPFSGETISLSASGLLLGQVYADGFELQPTYDRAGRLVKLMNNDTDRWSVARVAGPASQPLPTAMDASGRVLAEAYGNGITQTYARDVLGLPSAIAINKPASGGGTEALFATGITRNLYGAPVAITDTDGRVGSLDHTASYQYDAAARLISATQGANPSGPEGYIFRYQYDGLQNMVARAAKLPDGKSINVLQGVYRHGGDRPMGGGTYGPRQLTSVVGPQAGLPLCAISNVQQTFDYDAAGRMIKSGTRTMTFDAFDQLLSAQDGGAVNVGYHYGYDGFRTIKTGDPAATNTDAAAEFWFSAGHVVRNGETEHVITVGDRLVARIGLNWGNNGVAARLVWGPSDLWWGMLPRDAIALMCVLLAMLAVMLMGVDQARRRRRFAPGIAGVAIAALFAGGIGACDGTIEQGQYAWSNLEVTYLHQGVAAGPVLFTTGTGVVREERRYEPYGAELPAPDGPNGVAIPVTRPDPQNILNKETDRTTGWSYHGARWMGPEIARWLSPDPPVKAPDGKFMGEPWAMNPYGYVNQSPTLMWDPDGRESFATAAMRDQFANQRGAEAQQGVQTGAIRNAAQMGFGAESPSIQFAKQNLWINGAQSTQEFSALSSHKWYGNGGMNVARSSMGNGVTDTSLLWTVFGELALLPVQFIGFLPTRAGGVIAGGASRGLSNPIPQRMARVIPAEFVGGSRLGAPGAKEAWVTAADDLVGITTSRGLAERLTLLDKAGNLISGPRAIIEFDAVTKGLASPVFRNTPGFAGFGRTAGGAREFVLPNLDISSLSNVTTRIVP